MLVEALEAQEMVVVDRIELVPAEGERAVQRGPRASRRARLTVPVEPHEDAVLLVEQEGMYAWSYGTARDAAARRRTRGAAAVGRREVHFQLDLVTAAAFRAPSRGLITKLAPKAARIVVLRFAARVAVGGAMKFLERHVERRLMLLAGDDPSSWSKVEDFAQVVPLDKPARVLLFVHGTFSNTLGSFGDLGASPWGRYLLGAARARYDAVIGYDHPTLSEDPMANATDLYSRLSGNGARTDLTIDAISFSRGGLVYRSLAEQVLPVSGWRASAGLTAFVGCPNAGTPLAESDRWKTYIDLYTNLTAAAIRVVGLLPHLAAGAEIARAAVQSLGAFVKYVAAYATQEDAVPGIAAMQPGSPFLTGLNQRHPQQPPPAYGQVQVITSDFDAHVRDGEPKEFPKRLLMNIADGAIDRFMRKEPNDIVVPSESATALHPELAGFISDELDFGPNPNVYHTNYFTRHEVANALGRWLGLAPESILADDPNRPPPSSVGPEPPTSVDGDIVVAEATTGARTLRTTLLRTTPSFLVVTSPRRDEVYALPADEALEDLKPDAADTVESALDLGGAAMAPTLELDEIAVTDSTITGRTVVMDGVAPIGVAEPPGAIDSLELARSAEGVESQAQAPVRIRFLPSPAPVGPAPTVEALSQSSRGASRKRRGPPAARRQTASPSPARSGRGPVKPRSPVRATRSSSRGAGSPRGLTPPATVHVYIASEMPRDLIVNERFSISVTISRTKIPGAEGQTGGRVRAKRAPILIQVVPKENLELLDKNEDRQETELPSNEHVELLFDLKAVGSGKGEVWVYARQGGRALLKMRLLCQITKQGKPRRGRRTTSAGGQTTTDAGSSLDTLFIIERITGDQVRFDYRLYLNSIHKWARTAESKSMERSWREAYVESLYDELEGKWSSAGNDAGDFEELVRTFGGELLDQLMPTEFQTTLWNFRTRIGNVVVISEEPFIPWELVHLKQPGRDFPRQSLFLGQLGVVRWPNSSDEYPPDELIVRTGKALHVIPTYPAEDWELPEVGEERRFLEETLQARAVEPQPGPVLKVLKEHDGFDLLHFAGHGDTGLKATDQARLFLEGKPPEEDEEYEPPALLASQVKQLAANRLKKPNTTRPIVVLNACRTGRQTPRLSSMGGFADAFISKGAGAVVSSLWAVGDVPALRFVEEFYPRLKAGKAFGLAVREARGAARRAGDATWLAYAVYANPHATVTFV